MTSEGSGPPTGSYWFLNRLMPSAAGPERMAEFYKLATAHQLILWADLKHSVETDRKTENDSPSVPSQFRP